MQDKFGNFDSPELSDREIEDNEFCKWYEEQYDLKLTPDDSDFQSIKRTYCTNYVELQYYAAQCIQEKEKWRN